MLNDDYDDSFRQLHHQIGGLVQRAEQLKSAAQTESEPFTHDKMVETLEELSTSLEELQVTQEELYIQHEELLDTRHDLEDERQRYIDLFEFAPDGYLVTNPDGIIREANKAIGTLLNIRPDLLVGKPLQVYFSDLDRPEFILRVTEFLKSGAEVTEWEIQLLPRHSLPLIVTVTVTAIRSENGMPVALRWMFRDISHRKQIENEIRDLNTNLEERIRDRTDRLVQEVQLKDDALIRERTAHAATDALRETGMIISGTFDVGEVLKRILAVVDRIVRHDAADIILLEDGELAPACCHGYSRCDDTEFIDGLRFPLQDTYPLNEIARIRQPVMLSPLDVPLEWITDMEENSAFMSYLGVPIYIRSEIIGFINLTSRTPDSFNSEHIRLLELFSIQAAFAIQNARAHEDAKALLLLEERNRLARDLHDAVSQSLFTSSIIAETLLSSSTHESQSTDELLHYLVRLTRGALSEMRNLLLELRPAYLTDVDLPAALRRLVDAVWARKDIQIDLDINLLVPLPPDVQMAFYRIAQEALNNIVKHSQSDRAAITLRSDGVVLMTISDNGRGFNPEANSPGMGIVGMRERAQAVNAEFTIASTPDQGTSITVEWQRNAA